MAKYPASAHSIGVGTVEGITMKAWVMGEKRWGSLGEVRYLVTWEEVKASAKGNEEIDPDLDLNYLQHTFKDYELAADYAKRILLSGVTAYGALTVQKQRLEWFVEEDKVAEWEDIGESEEVSA